MPQNHNKNDRVGTEDRCGRGHARLSAGRIRPRLLAVVLGLVASPALAGVVSFDPPFREVYPGQTTVTFDLTIEADAMFDSVDLVIGSDLPIVGLTFAADFAIAMAGLTDTFMPVGIYEHDIFITGNGPTPAGPILPLGTLTIDTSVAPVGLYDVWIDSERDGISVLGNRGVPEAVSGSGLYGIPEPATLSLLALGAAWLTRRQRTHHFSKPARRTG